MATSAWTLYLLGRSCFRYLSETGLFSIILETSRNHTSVPLKGGTEPMKTTQHDINTTYSTTLEPIPDSSVTSVDKTREDNGTTDKRPRTLITSCPEINADTVTTNADLFEASSKKFDKPSLKLSNSSKVLFEILQTLDIETVTTLYREKDERTSSDTGIFCKNLFLKDRKAQFYLVICDENEQVDLKLLKRQLNACRNFSFGTPRDLESLLKQSPGVVSPFALLYEESRDVRVVLSETLMDKECLNFHPLDSNFTTKISFTDLKKFLVFCQHDLELIKI